MEKNALRDNMGQFYFNRRSLTWSPDVREWRVSAGCDDNIATDVST